MSASVNSHETTLTLDDRNGSGADVDERRGKSVYLARATMPAERAIFRSWRLTGRAEQIPELAQVTKAVLVAESASC